MAIRKRPGTDKWLFDYYDPNTKKRHQMQYNTQREAKAAEARIRTELKGNIHVADADTITLREAAELWIAACERDGKELSTINQYKGHVKNHIVPLAGSMKLNKIGVPYIHSFIDRLREKGVSEPTSKAIRTSFGAILANAQARGLVVFNAVSEARTAKRSGRHDKLVKVGEDIPTTAEVKAIIDGAKDQRARVFLRVAAMTGMRASELRGLEWKSIDLNKGEIEVSQRADAYRKLGSPKSSSGRRTIPIGPKLIAELREWKVACPSRSIVFPTRKGGVMDHSNIIQDWYLPAQIAGGVTVTTDKLDESGNPVLAAKYTGLHALRHFYASHCINAKEDGGLGLAPKVVQDRLGHSTITLTLDVYGHLFPKGDASAELAAAKSALF